LEEIVGFDVGVERREAKTEVVLGLRLGFLVVEVKFWGLRGEMEGLAVLRVVESAIFLLFFLLLFLLFDDGGREVKERDRLCRG
jgi:hypothetical protein